MGELCASFRKPSASAIAAGDAATGANDTTKSSLVVRRAVGRASISQPGADSEARELPLPEFRLKVVKPGAL